MDNIFRSIHASLSTFGVILNALLTYAVLTKSPKQIQSYGLLIINFALTDLLICLLNFLVMQRLISCGLAIVYISLGPCSLIGPAQFAGQICWTFYILKLHMYTHSIWLLLISFSYRYYVLIRQEVSRPKIQGLIFLIYIPSVLQLINIFMGHEGTEGAQEALAKYHPEILAGYEGGRATFHINPSIFDFTVMYVIIHVVGLSGPMAGAIIFMRKKIIEQLSVAAGGNQSAKSSKSNKLQIQLLRALTFQACIPVLYAIGGSCYLVQQFEIVTNAIPQYTMFCLFIMVPILNPISSFIFIAPYRQYILSIFHMTKRISVISSITAKNVSTSNS